MLQRRQRIERDGSHPHRLINRDDLAMGKETLVPGDFLVTHGTSKMDRLIRLMTNSHWNHAALITESNGTLIEALGNGLTRDNISKYDGTDFKIVRLEMSDPDREQVCAYANAMYDRRAKYGILTIVTIVLRILTKMRFVFKVDCTFICSEFVARSLAEGGWIWFKDTSLITPADLYNSCARIPEAYSADPGVTASPA